MSCVFGENRDIFFPKLSEELHLTTFSDIAVKFLKHKGLEPYVCSTEEEAREFSKTLPQGNLWPCLFTESDTTGEKDFEEFFTDNEKLDLEKYKAIGVIKNELSFDQTKLEMFEKVINELSVTKEWDKEQIVQLFHKMIPDFGHKETGKYLDAKM
jgi:hypothetical protein